MAYPPYILALNPIDSKSLLVMSLSPQLGEGISSFLGFHMVTVEPITYSMKVPPKRRKCLNLSKLKCLKVSIIFYNV